MKTNSKEMSKYRKMIKMKAKKFKMTPKDLHYLLDLFYMAVDDADYETLKLNKLDKWYDKFFIRIERICIPELYWGRK